MAKDNGIRERWMDEDPEVEGESSQAREKRQYTTDINVLAKEEIQTGKSNPRVGQREGEDAETMQADIRARVAELQDEAQLASIKKRFVALPGLHPDIEWEDVQAALFNDLETLGKIKALDAKGHEMNVMEEDNGEFVFVSCWTDYNQVSPDHKNIVFDRVAQDRVAIRYPQESCNGNAVEIVNAMGAELADEKYHNQLRGVTDVNGWAWLKTDQATRKAGSARFGDLVGVGSYDANNHYVNGAFRSELRVKEA